MTQTAISTQGPLVLVGAQNGVALIPSPTPLTRLNYFDGKFLRAEDLNREQTYLRSLVELSNRAGGSGVVHGFSVGLGAGGTLSLSPGLAIDPAGRTLFLPHAATLSIPELIEKSRAVATSNGGAPAMGEGLFAPCESASVPPPAVTTTFPTDLYLIALAHSEALCGEEDVYGKLCEEACITSTDRPFRLEGVVVRALPLALCPPTCDAPWLSATHRRSQVASAYFATERALYGREMSGTRLSLDLWCQGAAAETGTVVPLAVVSVNGDTVNFLDAWMARRERIESPPRRYWAWQMMMRPWNVFIAQILQFQCQLHAHLAGSPGVPGEPDPCGDQTTALKQAVSLLEEMERVYGPGTQPEDATGDRFRPAFLTRISDLKSQWSSALEAAQTPSDTRILINAGIVELPPVGYLPVVPGSIPVNTQVRRLLGEGVDLRFCIVRPDYVAHALEEAQHLERICLLQGLEQSGAGAEVDILVPDGNESVTPSEQGTYFETSFGVSMPSLTLNDNNAPAPTTDPAGPAGPGGPFGTPSAEAVAEPASRSGTEFRGAGRAERLPGGGGAFHFAGLSIRSADQVVGEVDTDQQPIYSVGEKASGTVPGAERHQKYAKGLDDLDIDLNRVFRGIAARFQSRTGEEKAANRAEAQSTSDLASRSTAAPALWTTMRVDRDPFALAVGESTPLRLEGAVGATVGRIMLGGQLVLQGDLYCDQKSSAGTARRLKGRAWGWLWAHARLQQGEDVNSPEMSPKFIPVTAEMEMLPATGGGGTLNIVVTSQQGFAFSVTTEWKGTPILAGLNVIVDLIEVLTIRLMQRAEGDPAKQKQVREMIDRFAAQRPDLRAAEIARARLQENPAVADQANPAHAAAVRALRTVEQALDQDGLRASAELLLFPPAPPRTTEKRVLATRDWVLFHRRRTSSCDCCRPEAKVVVPPRRYQVYEITFPRSASVPELRKFFASGASVEQLADVVGVVQFDGGTAVLSAATDMSQIQQGWKLANPSQAIIYGGIASVGAAVDDAPALGEQRAARVPDLVRGITPLHPAAQLDVFPLVPEGLSAQGVDGVIFLVTTSVEVATQRHRVIALRDVGMMDFVVRQIGQNELGEVVDNTTILGEVSFEAGTATVVDDSMQPVAQAWKEMYGAFPVGRALVVLSGQNPLPAAVAQGQGDAIAGAFNGKVTENTLTSSENVFGNVHAITILEPLPSQDG